MPNKQNKKKGEKKIEITGWAVTCRGVLEAGETFNERKYALKRKIFLDYKGPCKPHKVIKVKIVQL